MKKFKQLTGFTLAEVLITLGIIGAIAAFTIPTLIQKQQEKATVTAVKKDFSMISQVYEQAVQDNGTPDTWTATSSVTSAASLDFLNVLSPYLKITNNCGNGSGCFPNVAYTKLYSAGQEDAAIDTNNIFAKAQLTDGSSMRVSATSNNCSLSRGTTQALNSVCGSVSFDINGFKGPNRWGVDSFQFFITMYGIVPVGSSFAAPTGSGYTFAESCQDQTLSTTTGYNCSAWILYNENMDYLHCSDLAWDGKHKCSD